MTYVDPTQPLSNEAQRQLGEAVADLHGAAYVLARHARTVGLTSTTIDGIVRDVVRHALATK